MRHVGLDERRVRMCGCRYEHVLFHLNHCIIYVLHHYIWWNGGDETSRRERGVRMEMYIHSFDMFSDNHHVKGNTDRFTNRSLMYLVVTIT